MSFAPGSKVPGTTTRAPVHEGAVLSARADPAAGPIATTAPRRVAPTAVKASVPSRAVRLFSALVVAFIPVSPRSPCRPRAAPEEEPVPLSIVLVVSDVAIRHRHLSTRPG